MRLYARRRRAVSDVTERKRRQRAPRQVLEKGRLDSAKGWSIDYGAGTSAILRECADVAGELDDDLAADAWFEIAEAAERLLIGC